MRKRIGSAAVLSAAALLALAVLSLVPGLYKVHFDFMTSQEEHILAHFVAAAIVTATLRRRANAVATALMLVFYAGILEIGQNFVPGRDPEIEDLLASSLGVILGVGSTAFLLKLKARLHSSGNL